VASLAELPGSALQRQTKKVSTIMFTSLDEEIKRDVDAVSTPQGRWLRYAAVLLISALLFGGLYAGIRLLE
jgi:hypothetical protein